MLRIKTGMMYTWQKSALIGVTRSICIRPQKDSWAALVKLIPDWSSSVCSNSHKRSSTNTGCSFMEYQTFFQWDKLCGVWHTGQLAAFASQCTGIE